VLFHTLLHKENVTFSMLTGRKVAQEGEGIPSAHTIIALILLMLTGTWAVTVVKSYDYTTRSLDIPLTSTVLQFGKSVQDNGSHKEDDDD
jgi:hypothetical protein